MTHRAQLYSKQTPLNCILFALFNEIVIFIIKIVPHFFQQQQPLKKK